MRRHLVSAAVAVALSLVAGCAGDDDEAADAGTTTVSTTAPARADPCAGAPFTGMPEHVAGRTSSEADVDGDGAADLIQVFDAADGQAPPAWEVRVDLATGAAVSAALTPEGTDPTTLGGADLDGDGGAEPFVLVGAGASVAVVGVFRFADDCRLVPVTIDRQPARFDIGGGVQHGDGLRCEDGRLVAVTAMSDDGVRFTTEETAYRLAGTELVAGGPPQTGTLDATTDAAALAAAYSLDCPGVTVAG